MANYDGKFGSNDPKGDFDSLEDILNDDSALFTTSNTKTLNSKLFDTGRLKEIKKEKTKGRK